MLKWKSYMSHVYHLESIWRTSHVLVYHGPLLSHLLGVAPFTFNTGFTGIPHLSNNVIREAYTKWTPRLSNPPHNSGTSDKISNLFSQTPKHIVNMSRYPKKTTTSSRSVYLNNHWITIQLFQLPHFCSKTSLEEEVIRRLVLGCRKAIRRIDFPASMLL